MHTPRSTHVHIRNNIISKGKKSGTAAVTPELGTGSRDKRWCELQVQEEKLADRHHKEKKKKRLKVKSDRGRHTTSTFGL